MQAIQAIQAINPFFKPFVISDIKDPTRELIMSYFDIKNQFTEADENLEHTINNHYEAAKYMLNNPGCTRLDDYIELYLRNSLDYKIWCKKMPSQTPECFSNRQQNYEKHKSFDMANDFLNINFYLPIGQNLFHGGKWQCDDNVFTTNIPLSTTFSPEKALRNAEWKAKAYDSNEINLWLIKNCSKATKAFVYRIKETSNGHEKEVLIQSGCKMFLTNKILINDNYKVAKVDANCKIENKKVNAYLLEVEILN